jgi:hypothetical protein
MPRKIIPEKRKNVEKLRRDEIYRKEKLEIMLRKENQ